MEAIKIIRAVLFTNDLKESICLKPTNESEFFKFLTIKNYEFYCMELEQSKNLKIIALNSEAGGIWNENVIVNNVKKRIMSKENNVSMRILCIEAVNC